MSDVGGNSDLHENQELVAPKHCSVCITTAMATWTSLSVWGFINSVERQSGRFVRVAPVPFLIGAAACVPALDAFRKYSEYTSSK